MDRCILSGNPFYLDADLLAVHLIIVIGIPADKHAELAGRVLRRYRINSGGDLIDLLKKRYGETNINIK